MTAFELNAEEHGASSTHKIHVDRSKPLSLEKYLSLFTSPYSLDDEVLKEKYMREKYKEYL